MDRPVRNGCLHGSRAKILMVGMGQLLVSRDGSLEDKLNEEQMRVIYMLGTSDSVPHWV